MATPSWGSGVPAALSGGAKRRRRTSWGGHGANPGRSSSSRSSRRGRAPWTRSGRAETTLATTSPVTTAAAAVARLAADARAQSRAEGEQRARRVGVLVVAPLGLCFLPAFVLLGLVPMLLSLAGDLLS